MKLSKSDIQKIQGYFATQKDVVAVYLYGSFAYGNPHKGSDIDIAVLFAEELRSFDGKVNLYERLGRLYSEFPSLTISVEPEVREINLGQSPVFLRNVLRGKLIYSKDDSRRTNFEVDAMNIFRDTEYLRYLKYDYMKKSLKEGTYGYRLLNN